MRAAAPPIGQARPDWWIISEIAKRLDFNGFDYNSPKPIFNELCSLSPIYAGLDWNRIDIGVTDEFNNQWPVPNKDHPGTPRLHKGTFVNGKGIFSNVHYRDPAETINEDFPVWLTTGRRLQSYHTHTQTGRAQGIDYFLPEESLEVNPTDIEKWQLTDGEWCRMRSARGSIHIKVKATKRSPSGTVFASFSFEDVQVNLLTGSGYDPVTHTAELKVCR